jgi:hypothetical protein
MTKRRRAFKTAESVPATPGRFRTNEEVIAAITTLLGEIAARLDATPPALTEQPDDAIIEGDETVKMLLSELQTARYEVERAVDAVEMRTRGSVAAVMDGLSVDIGDG